MTEDVYFTLLISFAVACGAFVGRIIASEAQDRPTAVLAGAYCGAGAGLVGTPPFAFVITLIAQSWSSQFGISALIDAIEATGMALLWGIAGGAAGGLVLGILVAAFKK